LLLYQVYLRYVVDKASHFKTTRYAGLLHVNIDSEQDQTQIERALEELDR